MISLKSSTKNNGMKSLIIFDFYGVIGGEIAPKWFKNHFDMPLADELKAKYFIPADQGIYSFKETLERIAKDYNFNYDDILKEMSTYVVVNNELLDYILELRKNNDVALLSNAAKGIYDMLFPNLDLNKYFDKVFISAYHNMQKPDLRFYKLCVDSFNKEYDEIYMIDDNIKNISHLNEIGIKGILYKNNQELFDILKK